MTNEPVHLNILITFITFIYYNVKIYMGRTAYSYSSRVPVSILFGGG